MKTLKTAIFQIMEFYVTFGMDWPYILYCIGKFV
jgi:hypothetical protein